MDSSPAPKQMGCQLEGSAEVSVCVFVCEVDTETLPQIGLSFFCFCGSVFLDEELKNNQLMKLQ